MISKKELQYVNDFSSRVPYPGYDYSENALLELQKQFDIYNTNYKGKEYTIIFSDGTEITFQILPMNVAHIFGIVLDDLNHEYNELFKETVLEVDKTYQLSAYKSVELILQNMEKVLKYTYDNHGKVLNYYKIRVKCEIFNKFSDFSKIDFGCINFDREKYIKNSGFNFNGNAKKLFYVVSNEAVCPYFMMGILLNHDTEVYVSSGMYAPENPHDFFNDQEVVIPTQIIIADENELRKMVATTEEKMHQLNIYKTIIREYHLNNRINIYGDYETILADLNSNKLILK